MTDWRTFQDGWSAQAGIGCVYLCEGPAPSRKRAHKVDLPWRESLSDALARIKSFNVVMTWKVPPTNGR